MCALFSREPSPGWKSFNDNVLPALASGFHLLILLAIFALNMMAVITTQNATSRTGGIVFAVLIAIPIGLICIGWLLFLTRSYLLSFIAFIPVIIFTFPIGALQIVIARKAYNRWKGKE